MGIWTFTDRKVRSIGFTLVETVMVILIVGILSAIVLVQFHDFSTDAKSSITKDELGRLRLAITGDRRLMSNGQFVSPGYESDMGALPATLQDLVLNPVTGTKVQDYDPVNRRGWRGPYVDDSILSGYSKDSWGQDYLYNKAGRILRSSGKNGVDESGGGDDIQVSF